MHKNIKIYFLSTICRNNYYIGIEKSLLKQKKCVRMENYIKQLIGDIREASRMINATHDVWYDDVWDDDEDDDEDDAMDFSDVENYLYGEEQPISYITGIDADLLPPPEMLSVQQKADVARELEDLLETRNFVLDFPKTFPYELRYPFIRKFWSEKHIEMLSGTTYIEFCHYDTKQCPYPGYCQCLELDDTDDTDGGDHTPKDDDTLPF